MMTKKPGSRVGLVLFNVSEQDILVDLMPVSTSTICEVQEFWTSLVLHNKEIVWATQSPVDVVVLVDHRTQAKEIRSVIQAIKVDIIKKTVSQPMSISEFIKFMPFEEFDNDEDRKIYESEVESILRNEQEKTKL